MSKHSLRRRPRPRLTRTLAQSYYDDRAAKLEGWAVFWCDSGRLRIMRLDCPSDADGSLPSQPMFESDVAAMAHVRKRAGAGSRSHIAALWLHGKPCS